MRRHRPARRAPSDGLRRQARPTTRGAADPRGGREFAPLKQASSLGAEDMVITHLITRLELDIPVFVLETGMLHPETLDLLRAHRRRARARRWRSTGRAHEAVVQFVGREGKDAMYRSIELRKACCAHPQDGAAGARARRPAAPGSPACAASSPNARAEVPFVEQRRRRARTKINPLADWTWGDVWHYIQRNDVRLQPAARPVLSPASAARPARAPSAWARTSAPAAGGGRTRPRRNAACTWTAGTRRRLTTA